MKKKLTALVLSLVLAAMPATPIMNVQTVSAATTTKAAVQKNTWSKDHKYYYDKNGKKQSCTGNQYFKASAQYADGHGELKDQGTIVIGDAKNTTANDFVPLSVKYIKIKVTCEGVKDPVNVTIKQYPLEYIQGIAGWYSTKDGWIDWQTDQAEHNTRKTYNDDIFNARVYENNNMYEYYDSGTGWFGNRPPFTAQKDSRLTEQNNNQMYVVQITETDGTYVIGHGTSDNDDMVSPAFMLASQLGVVNISNSSFDMAKNHCDKYIEVNSDKKKYTDWRLPTPSEVKVICKYQNDKTQNVMSEVLKRQYYWTRNGQKTLANSKDNLSKGFIRCVRDLSPDEVKELENKKE